MRQEWSDKVDPDLFDAWFFEFASTANLIAIAPDKCTENLDKLHKDCGFPRSRDRTVVSVAITVAERTGGAHLTTEDVDYFDPTGKRSASLRQEYITGRRIGSVSQYLKKRCKVRVQSVADSTQEFSTT